LVVVPVRALDQSRYLVEGVGFGHRFRSLHSRPWR
jgi:hypothetical protein